MLLKRLAILAMTGLTIAGCETTANHQFVYQRNDGKPVDHQAFVSDRTICLGEMSKAQMAGTVIATGNEFIDIANGVERNNQADAVMRGCMAQKGYRLVELGALSGAAIAANQ